MNKFGRLIYSDINLTKIFRMRPCIMEGVRRHFAVSFFLVLVWKFPSKYGKRNSTFHSDKISSDNKC